jgi:hypothetical protein
MTLRYGSSPFALDKKTIYFFKPVEKLAHHSIITKK